jgi:hypothetical protein
MAHFRVPIFSVNEVAGSGETKWLTRFNEFTGAEWPALLNDISQSRYTPVIRPVNRQIAINFQGIQAQQQFSASAMRTTVPDDRLLALASADVSIRELPSGRELALFPGVYARNVKFDSSGRNLLVSSLRGLEVWPLESDPVDPHKIRVRTAKRVPHAIHSARIWRTTAMARRSQYA